MVNVKPLIRLTLTVALLRLLASNITNNQYKTEQEEWLIELLNVQVCDATGDAICNSAWYIKEKSHFLLKVAFLYRGNVLVTFLLLCFLHGIYAG